MSARVVMNGDGEHYAKCVECKWRAGAWPGILGGIEAEDDADQHNRNAHVNERLTVGGGTYEAHG